MIVNYLSLIYFFLVGGGIFFAGVILSWRSGDYTWQRKDDRFTLIFILLGFLLYLLLLSAWFFFALEKH